MPLKSAYEYLRHLNLTRSHREFSTDFLNRRPRHFDDLVCSRRQPSPAVLASLAVRLGDVAHQKRRDPDAEQQVAELERLIVCTFAELRKCFVTTLPRKRPAMNIPMWRRK
jgi:uncharacterized membrane protein YccC